MRVPTIFVGLTVVLALPVGAQSTIGSTGFGGPAVYGPTIESVLIHPLHATLYMCGEHSAPRTPEVLGDALGTDCMVLGDADGADDANLPAQYRTDGRSNEDYFGWGEPVLAPFDGVVDSVAVNPVTNEPGHLVAESPTLVVVRGRDSTCVAYAHLRDLTVRKGDAVAAGQPMGVVGNNGRSWAPHVHVAAWRGDTPLQVRFDQRKMEGR